MKRYKLRTPYYVKGSYDWGKLYPIGCIEVLQGQTTLLDTSVLFRAMPLQAPAYEKMTCRVVHFYVPFRIIWSDFDEFITGQMKVNYPRCIVGDIYGTHTDFSKTLVDYFGLPTNLSKIGENAAFMKINYFPFLAYFKIWNDWFRDEVIQTEVDLEALMAKFVAAKDTDSALNSTFEGFKLKNINWGSDRFTRALLASEANPDILIPVASSGGPLILKNPTTDKQTNVLIDAGSKLYGDVSVGVSTPLHYAGGLSGFSTAEFKMAQALYNFKINEAKFGKDYVDYRKKYGLSPIDGRLGRSERIGGFSGTISISDVLGTGDNNLGMQGGNAMGFTRGRHAYKHYAPEHGMIISLMYVRPKASYSEGIPRMYLYQDMLDFYQMEFKDVGFQEIYQDEIQLNKTDSVVDKIFGYEPRYNHYRSEMDRVCGELKTGKPLSHWANPRTWNPSTPPALNNDFLECKPTNQIWASGSTDKFIGYIHHKIKKASFVPPFSDPKFPM